MAIALEKGNESAVPDDKSVPSKLSFNERMKALLNRRHKSFGEDERSFSLSYFIFRMIVTKCEGGLLSSSNLY